MSTSPYHPSKKIQGVLLQSSIRFPLPSREWSSADRIDDATRL